MTAIGRFVRFAADLHTYLVGGKRIDSSAPLKRAASLR